MRRLVARVVLGLSVRSIVGIDGTTTSIVPTTFAPTSTIDYEMEFLGQRFSVFSAETLLATASSSEDGGSASLSLRRRNPSSTVNDAVLAEYERRVSPRLMTEAKRVTADESERPAPNLIEEFEDVPGLGRLTLDYSIATERYSRVFAVKEDPNIVIKYQTNCDLLRQSVHPLIVDYVFSNIAADAFSEFEEVSRPVMKPTYLSPPSLFPVTATRKTTFAMTVSEWEKCKNHHATVRFVVLPRAMQCLNKLRMAEVTTHLHSLLSAGALLVRTIANLHNVAGIIHGDIHAGNICFLTTGQVVLIDFGKAGFVEEEEHEPSRPALKYVHPAQSPWQMAGFRSARRDDIFKALFTLADTVHRGKLFEHAISLFSRKNFLELKKFKAEEFFFITASRDPIADAAREASLSEESMAHIREQLEQALALVRGLESVDTPIDYDGIRARLLEAASQIID
jgi:hypothetical protein